MQREYRAKRTTTIGLRVPADLAQAIEEAAAKELISVSDYVRRAALRSVQLDGIEIAA